MSQEDRYMQRYAKLIRDVMATLPRKHAIGWINKHRALAKRSIAQLEQQWALDKHRIQTGAVRFGEDGS